MRQDQVYFWLGIVLSTQSCVTGDMDTELMLSKLDDLDVEIVDIRGDMARIEEKIVNKIDLAKVSLRSELKQHITEQVRESMAEILQGESFEDMVKSQVVSEVRQLQNGVQQMKRQLEHLRKSFRHVQEDRNMYREALLKAERNTSQSETCSQYLVDMEILQWDFDHSQEQIKSKETEIKQLEHIHKLQIKEKEVEIQGLNKIITVINQTCLIKMRETKTVAKVTESLQAVTTTTVSTTSPPPSTPAVSTTSPQPSTTRVSTTSLTTTTQPEEDRNRIIVSPWSSGKLHQFRQLNLPTNSVNSYQCLKLKYVYALVYTSKLRKLLIAVNNPGKIMSSNLDSCGVKTIKRGVHSYGMAVDEDRQLLFMTTTSPGITISQMTTHGKNFTLVTNLHGSPYGIAVNSVEKTIYASIYSSVLMVSYDGRVVQTLANGKKMYSLTLDDTGSFLYYNRGEKLLKRCLSDNETSEVIRVKYTHFLFNMRYHNNKIYFTSPSLINIGVVEMGHSTTTKYKTLQKYLYEGMSTLAMCLVP